MSEHDAKVIRKAVAYLKKTPAVTLVGKGGAYELLEAYAQKLEAENTNNSDNNIEGA